MAHASKGYHHGDLRAALISEALTLTAERDVEEFSVAELARRLGVSTAAPYRHFKDRDALLAAVAQAAITQLTTLVEEYIDRAGPDPVDRFAASAAAYVHYGASSRGGFDLFLNVVQRSQHDAEVDTARLGHVALMRELATAAANDRHPVDQLIEHHFAITYGYGRLFTRGLFTTKHNIDTLATQAADACRQLATY